MTPAPWAVPAVASPGALADLLGLDPGQLAGLGDVRGCTGRMAQAVAHTLTALCVTVVPRAEWAALARPDDAAQIVRHHRLGRRRATPHLPQGAPTSLALASLAAGALDRRLAALAPTLLTHHSR